MGSSRQLEGFRKNSVRRARSQDESRRPPQSRFITAQMGHFQAAGLNNTSHMTNNALWRPDATE